LDFDRERAMALGDAALKEAQKAAKKNETRILNAKAVVDGMPHVPSEPEVPQSLGGLVPHMLATPDPGVEQTMGGLAERAAELTEDIAERSEVAHKILADDAEEAEGVTDLSSPIEDEV
jgi:hypothetical protein